MSLAASFLVLNRGAYKGYFQDDEFDHIVNTRVIAPVDWLYWFITPQLSAANFRPAGHIYFFSLNSAAGLRFPKYIAVMHFFHLLNGALLWMILRTLRIKITAALAGVVFFILNVSAFETYWKPMFIFDMLCGTFSLATLLLYARGNWIAAIPMMWLAYKSKELAVVLPAALLAYEVWFGNCQWKRLMPFFLISLCFGFQAILSPQPKGSPYAFVFTLAAIGKTLQFYSSQIFLLPFAGLLLIGIPFLIRDRRIWFGAIVLAAFLAPLMFLPMRMYSGYTYIPLTGAAIELAVLASMVPPAASLAFFALWIPWNIMELRADRKTTLTADDQVRVYARALMDFVSQHPKPPVIAVSSKPDSFQMWGIVAALNYPNQNPETPLRIVAESAVPELPPQTAVTFINWDRAHSRVRFLSKDPNAPDAAYLNMGPETPFWQLDEGWYGLDDYFRWTKPRASAHLRWPSDAGQFEAVLNVSRAILNSNGYIDVRPSINGHDLGVRHFDRPGIETLRWPIPARDGSEAVIELRFTPQNHLPPDPRVLGAPVVAFGFVKGDDGH